MRTPIALLVSALLVLPFAVYACSPDVTPDSAYGQPAQPPNEAPGFADPEVQRIHSAMMAAMDPQGAFERNRFLHFDWIVQRAGGEPLRRTHTWDRWEGRARVHAPTDDGEMVALFSTDAPEQGRVWLDGVETEGDSARTLLTRARGMHINDSYWLIMPYKWADPGVITEALEPFTDESGTVWDVVQLSFENVGLTPQNLYRAYINPTSGLMERWAHYRTSDADPFFADWTQWTEFSGAHLSLDKPWADGGRIWFENVVLDDEVPRSAFAPPGTGS